MMDFLTILPPEMIEKVFSYLPVRDLIVCGTICKSWRAAANNPRLWKALEKNYEDWLLPDSRAKTCDVITSNFKDKSRSIEALMPRDGSELNRLKVFVCQRNFLKHNWSHRIFTHHCLQLEGEHFEEVQLLFNVCYPSKSPYDCLYFPFKGKYKDGSHALMLMRLDNEPHIVGKLSMINDWQSVNTICLMRDCVIWLNENDVNYFSLTLDFDKSEMLTLGSVDYNHWRKFLSMDSKNIVAAGPLIYVWSKETLTLRCVIDSTFEGMDASYSYGLYDGCLIQGVTTLAADASLIKIYNIKDDRFILENEFEVARNINSIKIEQNIFCLFLNILEDGATLLIVYDRQTLTNKFSIDYRDDIYADLTPSNDCISFADDFTYKMNLCKFSPVVEQNELTDCYSPPYFVFDNITLIYGKSSLEVWDWKRKTKLYDLCDAEFEDMCDDELNFTHRTRTSVVHVSEARLIFVDSYGHFQFYSFG